MLTFNGIDDRVLNVNTGLNAITNNFTMEMWVNPTATLTIRRETNSLGNTEGISGQRYIVTQLILCFILGKFTKIIIHHKI